MIKPRTAGVKVIGIAAACISISTAVGAAIWANDKMTTDAEASIHQSTVVLAAQVDLAFHSLNKMLKSFSQTLMANNSLSTANQLDLNEMLDLEAQEDPTIYTISIVDADGWINAHSTSLSIPKTYVGDRPYFIAQRDGVGASRSKLFIGEMIQSRVTGKYLIPISRKLEKDNKFLGVIFGALEESYFTSLFSKMYRPVTGEISLRNDAGGILIKYPQESVVSGDVLSLNERIPDFNLIVGMQVSMKTLREAWRTALMAVVLSSLLTSILILILTIYATKRITQEQDWTDKKQKATRLSVINGGKLDD